MAQRKRRLESHFEAIFRDENSFRAFFLFTSVSSAYVDVTKYSAMGLRPSMAQKSAP